MRSCVFVAALVATFSLYGGSSLAQQVTKENVPGIRNLARLETTVACAGAITPESVVEVKKMGFVSIVNLRLASEEGANVEKEEAAAKAAGLRYFHVPYDGSADPKAALISTLDVGQFDNLHPPDKLPVGLRMAMAAKGEPMPLPTHVAKLGEGYAVFMEGTGGRLHTWSGNRVLGVELCGETQDSCRYAEAVATLNGMLIADDGKPATRVRYAWSDAPVVNLFDGRGLPIPGFELPIGP